MNTNELTQILTQAEKIGLATIGELAELFRVCKYRTNNDKINGVNDIFCRDWWEVASLIEYVKNYKEATK